MEWWLHYWSSGLKLNSHEYDRRAAPRTDRVVDQADIYALASDRDELVALGITLGRFNLRLNCFEGCVLSAEALNRLAALGGKYLWDLLPRHKIERSSVEHRLH